MSKAIKWQIPFVSTIDKIQYRIDIYAEGYTGTPIQLTGGTNPIKTEEDKSDNFFAPVRGQTGNIEVLTKLPNGGTLDINDLLPSDNIDHPVRLVSISGNTETIEWQGFMACEAYSQNYTSIPDTFSFPIISVLEAMASVQADPAMLSGLNNVGETIQQLLEIFIKKAGISYFSQYYIPTTARGRNILSKYVDATVLYEQKEYNNENSTTYIVSGLSLQECLARIATYMGWCCREVSGSLYFFAAGETSGYMRHYRQGILDPSTGIVTVGWMVDLKDTAVVSRDIVALLWAGVDHKRTVQQGAKSVEVVAKLEKYEFSMGLPDCPLGDLREYTSTMIYKTTQTLNEGTETTIITNANNDDEFINICEFSYFDILYSNNTYSFNGYATLEQVFANTLANPSYIPGRPGSNNQQHQYIGAFMANMIAGDEQGKSGLYITGTCKSGAYSINSPSDTNHVFEIKSLMNNTFKKGKFILKIDFESIMIQSTYGGEKPKLWCGPDGYSLKRIDICIKLGNKYWDGSSWSDNFSFVFLNLGDLENNQYDIPIPNEMFGEVSIRLYGRSRSTSYYEDVYMGVDTFVTELSLDYEMDKINLSSDRSENHYFRLLGTNFRDEISIGTELASWMNNQPSPSIIRNAPGAGQAMTELNYGTTQAPDMRRPEVDLLNRLATYYGAARQRLDLIVEHPTAAPLPLLRLNGISPDNRKYLPLAESRDWINDTSTLTCFETPNNE